MLSKKSKWFLVPLLLGLFYFSTQFATSKIIGGDDGHFHIQFSRQIFEHGIPHALPQLHDTIYRDAYRDPHLLFHLLLIPFSLLPDKLLGAKLAAATFATLAALVFWWALIRLRANTPWLWLLLFVAGSGGFLFRLQMPRAQSLALALTLITIVALLERRLGLLFLVGFLHVWLYDAFWILLVIALVYCEVKPFLFLMAGLAAGSVVNPYFPGNFVSYFQNFERALLSVFETVPLPAEWYSVDPWSFVATNAPILFVGVGLLIGLTLCKQSKENKRESVFLGIIALIYLVLACSAQRFIEYLPPIALLFFASLQKKFWPQLTHPIKTTMTATALVVSLGAGGLYAANFSLTNQPDETYNCYLKAGLWMEKHIPKNELIFTTDWDDFPILYMQAPQLRFLVGLDPRWMLEYNRNLYALYRDITQGKIAGPYAEQITKIFESHTLFSDTEHSEFLDIFDKEPNVYRVFNEQKCRIYMIKDKRPKNDN